MKKRVKGKEDIVFDYNEAQKEAIEEKARVEAEKTEKTDKEQNQEWVRQQLAILRKGIIVDVEGIEGLESGRGTLNLKLIMIHEINGVPGYNNVSLKMTSRILMKLLSELQKVQAQSVREEQDEWRKD